jgi:hypothetical protein
LANSRKAHFASDKEVVFRDALANSGAPAPLLDAMV